MEIIKLQEDHCLPLFLYWNRLAEKVPYFFPVSPEKWRACLLEDKLGDENMFLFQEIWIAVERGQIVGFCQYGRPAFAWDNQGQRYFNPQIGILRHFYFDEDRVDAADLLFRQSETYLSQFSHQHAFYHIFGMSCNAYHGKLYHSLDHVDRYLREHGYEVEHENVYYTLDLRESQPVSEPELELVPRDSREEDTQEYQICLAGHPIGIIQLRTLERLTGGITADIAYLTWIEIDGALRHQGWGTRSMKLLIAHLGSRSYGQLHLDTASANHIAQRFYEHLGFENRGKTTSHFKTTSC